MSTKATILALLLALFAPAVLSAQAPPTPAIPVVPAIDNAAIMRELKGVVPPMTGDNETTIEDLRPRKAIMLSMQEAIRLTLENSMQVKINRVAPAVALAAVEKAEANFDWSFVSTWQSTYTATPSLISKSSDKLTKAETNVESVQVGLQKQLESGGKIQPGIKIERDGTASTSSTYSTAAYVQITQPLLRNAGTDVNLAPVWQSRNSADMDRCKFKDSVLTTLLNMQQTYWDLVFAIEDLDVKRKALRLTRDTLEQTEAQVEAGVLASIEIARVRADLASKESDIITAQQTVQDKEDQIRQYINKRGSRLLDDTGIIPLERAAYKEVSPDVESEAMIALGSRPDYRADIIQVKNADLDLVIAKNQKLPVVDVQATLSVNGLGNDMGDSFRALGTGKYPEASAQVSVDIPLGNRAAKAGYLTARLNKVKALLVIKNDEDTIIIQIKRDVRQVYTSLKLIRSTRIARELAEERLRAEVEKFNVGTALILDVLNAQTLLSQAESAERQAVVNYNKALIQLERDKGTLLERDRIFLNTELGPPRPATMK